MSSCSDPALSELISTMSELLHDERASKLAYNVFVALFPQVWAHFSDAERDGMVKPIVAALSKDAPHRHSSSRPNTVQAWLHALSMCRPMPKLPAGLLKYLARSYGAWHSVIPMMLHQAVVFPTEAHWYDGLSDVASQLHDRDLYCAIWSKRAAHADTRRALAFEQLGVWQSAQTVYVDCMSRWQMGEVALINTPKAELALWELGVVLSKEPQSVGTLDGVLQVDVGDTADAADGVPVEDWRLGKAEDLFSKYAPGQPRIKMLQTYAAIHEELPDAEAEQRRNPAALGWDSLLLSMSEAIPAAQIFQQFRNYRVARAAGDFNGQRSNQAGIVFDLDDVAGAHTESMEDLSRGTTSCRGATTCFRTSTMC